METKKHARELVTSSSSARVSNKSLMLILILISTLALIIFTPKKVKAAYNDTIGTISMTFAEAIKSFYTDEMFVNHVNASATQAHYENAKAIYDKLTAQDFYDLWNNSVVEVMSQRALFDTWVGYTSQCNMQILGYNNNLKIIFYFSSDGSNTGQMEPIAFRAGPYDWKQGAIFSKDFSKTLPMYVLVYEVYYNNENEFTYDLTNNYENGLNGSQAFYRYDNTNMQYTLSGDELYLPGFINLSREYHDCEIYNGNNYNTYYVGYYVGQYYNASDTNTTPTTSGYTGTIYNESGDITGTISGEIDNENIVGALTDVPDLSGETISSGEIEQAVGVQLAADPYDNFWYQFSTGIASALTASTASMEINWLGTRQTITSDMFDLPLPQDIKNLITLVSNVTLCWLMLKWTKEIVDGIHEGGILHIVHRGWESYTAYM